MKRLVLLLVCIAILVLFLARGDGEDPAPEPRVAPPRRAPLPLPGPRVDRNEAALGIYILEGDGTEIALELQPGRRFRSTAKFPGRDLRATAGTWSLAGPHLTLTYRTLGGEPLAEGPKMERCRYLDDRIELNVPGRDSPVVLKKVAFIRSK